MSTFVIVDAGNAVRFGPALWQAAVFRDELARAGVAILLGDDPPAAALSWPGVPLRILPCTVSREYDPRTQELGAPVLTVDGDAAHQVYPAVDRDVDALRAERLAELERRAAAAEVAGIDVGGWRIDTHDRAKTLLNGLYRRAEKNPGLIHRWDGWEGEVQLTSAQVIAIGDAVAEHVQNVFNHKLDVAAALRAAHTAVALHAVDLYTGWPGEAPPVGGEGA